MTEYNFDPIRPYYQHEIPDAIERVAQNPQFDRLLNYLFPDEDHQKLKDQVRTIKNTGDFQLLFMLPVIESILSKTAGELSVSGMENLSPSKGYVFVANHRDIILDSSIIALHLVRHGHQACKITWGDNLMISPFVVDIGKINRMITVFREGSPKEMLKNSILLSAYIRQSVTEKNQTVWIAQRKGRSKDGNDTTDVSVLKMLSLTGGKQVIDSLKALNIIPVTISYEWEPCDAMKVRELYLSDEQEYVKEAGEDLNSIIGGVVSNKGRIHVNFGLPINDYLDTLDSNQRPNELLDEIAGEIDVRIQAGYKLWPGNLMAYEWLKNDGLDTEHYEEVAVQKFNRRLKQSIEMTNGDEEMVKNFFLKLYANPVINKQKKAQAFEGEDR
jgi:hypothetical protein